MNAEKFNQESAKQYDEHIVQVVPGYALFASLASAFCQLHYPNDAKIAVIGAGTGYELKLLCAQNQRWRFVAIEPALPMLQQAKQRCHSYSQRIDWHHGTLATLEAGHEFDIVVCLWVLHFLIDAEKQALLGEIKCQTQGQLLLAERLLPANTLMADMEMAHALYLGVDETQHALMQQRLPAMPALTAQQAQAIYRQSGWRHQHVLARVINYQLCCLS